MLGETHTHIHTCVCVCVCTRTYQSAPTWGLSHYPEQQVGRTRRGKRLDWSRVGSLQGQRTGAWEVEDAMINHGERMETRWVIMWREIRWFGTEGLDMIKERAQHTYSEWPMAFTWNCFLLLPCPKYPEVLELRRLRNWDRALAESSTEKQKLHPEWGRHWIEVTQVSKLSVGLPWWRSG